MKTPCMPGLDWAHRPSLLLLVLLALVRTPVARPLSAQASDQAYPTEQVSYHNAEDSTYLTATLTLPASSGPHSGVVLLSIAGTDPLVDHLAGLGYAVLLPVRRGLVAVEPLLQATYADLAGDAEAALDYLRSRPDIDGTALGLVGQADDAPPAMMAVAQSTEAIPLVLLAPPGFPGSERFRLEQRGLADRPGARPEDLEALDELVGQIASIVLTERLRYTRESRLRNLMARSRVRLPYNAAFPQDDRQVHFFASPLWHDRLAFEPEAVLAQLHAPVLVLIGTEDPGTPMDAYLAAVRRGLSAAPAQDTTVCPIAGRTRHSFTDGAVAGIASWLGERMAAPDGTSSPLQGGRPSWCLEDPD